MVNSVAKLGGCGEWEIAQLGVDTGRDENFNIERSQKKDAVVVGFEAPARQLADYDYRYLTSGNSLLELSLSRWRSRTLKLSFCHYRHWLDALPLLNGNSLLELSLCPSGGHGR